MVAIWTKDSPFLQTPIYQPKDQPDFKLLPYPTIGTDMSSGKRDVDIAIPFPQPGNAIPPIDEVVEANIRYQQAMQPLYSQQMQEAADLSSRQTTEQLAALYPFLSRAGQEATARQLGASKEFLAFKERQPSAQQARMATAAAAESELGRTIAMQQQAAKDFAGKFAGQYISYS